MITTKTHGYIDYLMGILLIILPFIANFPRGAATTIPVILGLGTIMYSLITDYELSVANLITVKMHLALDLIAGVLLAVSPWVFGFSEEIYLPFLILGIGEIIASLMTSKKRRYPLKP
ncbi:hypothetical protein ED312_10560 [Sinomicrobium pectinilyticum]|uniref:SPW repeat-containing integral membrane domain-containing protein n=1 Tax=Sinomicrobium pectinilyticum TaxID=1084421 RepID=A0A3N0EH90_SINP1|nr:SPW repeat protein [Sinomicrobium pectinilyticum]RNL87243.1 hypothetical protein ED312_10560 [Sinomicrobium pectinilyticum]